MAGTVDTRHRMRVWQAWLSDSIRGAGTTRRDLSQTLADRGMDATTRRLISIGSIPPAEIVAVVALTLGEDPAVALQAAGYPLLAALMRARME